MKTPPLKFQPKYALIEVIGTGLWEKTHTAIWLDDEYKLIYTEYNWILAKRMNCSEVKYENIKFSNVFDEVILEYHKIKQKENGV